MDTLVIRCLTWHQHAYSTTPKQPIKQRCSWFLNAPHTYKSLINPLSEFPFFSLHNRVKLMYYIHDFLFIPDFSLITTQNCKCKGGFQYYSNFFLRYSTWALSNPWIYRHLFALLHCFAWCKFIITLDRHLIVSGFWLKSILIHVCWNMYVHIPNEYISRNWMAASWRTHSST